MVTSIRPDAAAAAAAPAAPRAPEAAASPRLRFAGAASRTHRGRTARTRCPAWSFRQFDDVFDTRSTRFVLQSARVGGSAAPADDFLDRLDFLTDICAAGGPTVSTLLARFRTAISPVAGHKEWTECRTRLVCRSF